MNASAARAGARDDVDSGIAYDNAQHVGLSPGGEYISNVTIVGGAAGYVFFVTAGCC